MRILFISQTFPLYKHNHTAHFMLDFIKGFKDSPTILLPYHKDLNPYPFVSTFKYIWPTKFHFLGFGQSLENDQKLKTFNYLLIPFYIVFGSIAAIKLIRVKKIDAINTHWIVPNGPIALIAAYFTNISFYITVPGSDAYLVRKNKIFSLVSNLVLKRARGIISNSPQLLKDLKVKGKVIQYPVPLNKTPRIYNQVPRVATAGRFVEKKGFDIVKKIYPTIEIISGLDINEFRKELASVDIFVCYSIRDKSGNLDDSSVVLLEAMSAGCAVIASDLPGNRSLGAGILVKSPKELKLAIEKLKKSKVLRKKMGRQAQDIIKTKFTPEKIAKEYINFFSEQ